MDANRIERLDKAIRTAVRKAWLRSEERGTPFNIDYIYAFNLAKADGFICAITRIPFEVAAQPGKAGTYSLSLDRIVSEQGYVKGNIRFILHGLNALKGISSDIDVRRICTAVVRQLGEHNV